MNHTVTLTTHGAKQTAVVAAALGALLRPGDLVVLTGGLGTGKTTFVQGVAQALGVTEAVTSPTFAIVQEYSGRVPVAHVDVYRLERVQELHDLGFEELLEHHVVLVEWGELVAPVLPADRVTVALAFGAGPDDRTLVIAAEGSRWATRRERLAAALTDGAT